VGVSGVRMMIEQFVLMGLRGCVGLSYIKRPAGWPTALRGLERGLIKREYE
jgi:hypothetical protein